MICKHGYVRNNLVDCTTCMDQELKHRELTLIGTAVVWLVAGLLFGFILWGRG